MRRILLILLILFSTTTSWAANCGGSPTIYYVDYVGGSDSNNGTSTSTPWKTCPGSATKTCTLQAGDTVIFKGGVTYSDAINSGQAYPIVVNITTSGSSGNPITYDGNSAGTFGTGKAIIDAQLTSWKGFYLSGARSYITIKGFIIKNMLNTGDSGTGRGVAFISDSADPFNPSYNITISYNDFSRDSYTPVILSPPIECPACIYNPTGRCINQYSGNNWDIHHNTFADCGGAVIDSLGSSSLHVYNNYFTGVACWTLGYNVFGANQTWTDFQFHDNTIANMNSLYHGKYNNCHEDYLYVYQGPDLPGSGEYKNHATYSNFGFYNNLFYNTATTGVSGAKYMYLGSNADGNVWDGLYIFNNIFVNVDASYAFFMEDRTCDAKPCQGIPTWKNVYILNNTTYTNRTDNTGGFFSIYLDNPATPSNLYNWYVINNIVYAAGSQYPLIMIPSTDHLGDVFRVDHNIYRTNYGGYYFRWDNRAINGGECPTCIGDLQPAGWQALYVGSNYFDPAPSQFGVNPYVKNATDNPPDMHLTTQSTVAIGQGVNLTLWCTSSPSGASSIPLAACKDKDGVARSASAAWDIGAYQYGAAAIPSSVKGLTIQGGTIK